MDKLFSVIINNYNYGRFLAHAIDSALAQTHANTEVLVVDDGSTDDSREVIASYGSGIRPILKENGGQASAFNAGFTECRGEVVLYLDSDDALVPTAVERIIELFGDGGGAVDDDFVKAHWPLRVMSEDGHVTDRILAPHPPAGDFRAAVQQLGPSCCPSPPTSGNAWSRAFLQAVLPMPEAPYRLCADDYLCALAPACGPIHALEEPLSLYRMHGRNNWVSMTFEQKLESGLKAWDRQLGTVSQILRERGVAVDVEVWKSHSWFHRVRDAIADVAAIVPPGATMILVDNQEWGTGEVVDGRHRIPFLERDGQYWGAPPDDETALRELERLRSLGAGYVVFAWPAFWWLDYYVGLREHLHSHYRCRVKNSLVIIFDLTRTHAAGASAGANADRLRRRT